MGNAGHGLAVFSGSGRTALVTVESSTASLNGNAGFAGTTSGGTTLLTVRSSVAETNGASGVFASGVGATVSVTGSTLVRNTGFGLEQDTSSVLRSLVNNTVEDNVAGADVRDDHDQRSRLTGCILGAVRVPSRCLGAAAVLAGSQ